MDSSLYLLDWVHFFFPRLSFAFIYILRLRCDSRLICESKLESLNFSIILFYLNHMVHGFFFLVAFLGPTSLMLYICIRCGTEGFSPLFSSNIIFEVENMLIARKERMGARLFHWNFGSAYDICICWFFIIIISSNREMRFKSYPKH